MFLVKTIISWFQPKMFRNFYILFTSPFLYILIHSLLYISHILTVFYHFDDGSRCSHVNVNIYYDSFMMEFKILCSNIFPFPNTFKNNCQNFSAPIWIVLKKFGCCFSLPGAYAFDFFFCERCRIDNHRKAFLTT